LRKVFSLKILFIYLSGSAEGEGEGWLGGRVTSETSHSLGWEREKQVAILSSCRGAKGTRSLKLGCGGHRCTHFLTKGCGRDHRCQQHSKHRGREAGVPTSQRTPMMRRDKL